MKKQNQTARKSKRTTNKGQQESKPFASDISISRRRADVLSQISKRINANPQEIGENAIASYLKFINKFPALAEAQPRFVRNEVTFAVLPSGDLYDQLDRACAIYSLDRNSVVDSAIGAYLDMALREQGSAASQEMVLRWRGSSDPENIAFILSQAGESARSMFDKLVTQIGAKPFMEACNDFNALRELTMHHPAFETKRHALEMIAEGSARLQ